MDQHIVVCSSLEYYLETKRNELLIRSVMVRGWNCLQYNRREDCGVMDVVCILIVEEIR